MRIVRILALSAFCALASLGFTGPVGATTALDAVAPNVEPTQVIEQFHDTLLGVMKDGDTLGYQGRYDTLSPIILRTFNLVQMAQMSVGSFWSKLDQPQRQALVDSFTRLSVATYAHRFDHFSGQSFRVSGEPQKRGEAVLVPAELVRSDGEVVSITYYMRHFDAGWQTVDVFLKGAISEMATRRSEYSSVLQREGLDGLIKVIDDKARSYAGA